MEFADGETLAERLARGPMPVCDVLPIARQIAEALEAAHEKGIIHRDLKRYKKGRPCCGRLSREEVTTTDFQR